MTRNLRLARHWIFALIWATLALALPTWGHAAVPLRIDLTPDGSAVPPGDLLKVEVLFFPGESEVTLEVRAFRIEEEPKYLAEPIPARNKLSRDAQGNYFQSVRVTKPQESRAAMVTFVIPYAQLGLRQGMHGLAYEITGKVGKEVAFVRPTKLAYVIVTDKTRTEMQLEKEATRVVPRMVRQPVSILKEGKLTTVDAELEIQQPTFELRSQNVKVSIPGEFQRPLLARAMPEPREDDDIPPEALPLGGAGWESLDKFEPKAKRSILYATNRTIADEKVFTPKRYGKEAAAHVTYGAAQVNIPVEAHRKGELEVPSWWSNRDPRKHFLVETLSEFSVEEFQKQTAQGDVLLVVHGYNTSFEFAVLRAAQLVHDLEFPGQGVAFSWPSAASTTGYWHDEEQVDKSAAALVEVFEKLLAAPRDTPRQLHVIAHSMGNRVFLNAVRLYHLKHPDAEPFLGQVALAAPDIDGASFAALLPSVQRLAKHVTFYYCSSDRALVASRTVHQDKPVGLGPWFAEGIETINSDNANTEMLGHGYYASSHPLLIDLRLLLVFGEPADQRLPPLMGKSLVLGYPLWAFSPLR
jgi:esterase/lipase superfamily enzyme